MTLLSKSSLLLLLLPLCTHDGRRGEKQLSGFCQLCGLEHIKTHRVLKHGLHVVYPSLSWATFCPSPTAACSIRTKGRLVCWQSHQMSKPLHSLLIDIIHDWVYTDSFSNVLVPDLIPPSLICSLTQTFHLARCNSPFVSPVQSPTK